MTNANSFMTWFAETALRHAEECDEELQRLRKIENMWNTAISQIGTIDIHWSSRNDTIGM